MSSWDSLDAGAIDASVSFLSHADKQRYIKDRVAFYVTAIRKTTGKFGDQWRLTIRTLDNVVHYLTLPDDASRQALFGAWEELDPDDRAILTVLTEVQTNSGAGYLKLADASMLGDDTGPFV